MELEIGDLAVQAIAPGLTDEIDIGSVVVVIVADTDAAAGVAGLVEILARVVPIKAVLEVDAGILGR